MPPRVSPFTKPEVIRPRIKAVLRGPMGSGKTHAALKSPGRVAVIDTEGAAQWYVGRPGFPEFDIMRATNYADVVNAVDWLAANPGIYETLVIDSMSLIYTRLQDSATAARTAYALNKGVDPMDVDIEGRDWNKISRLSKTLGAKLINLPMHVIVISREKEKKNKQGEVVDYLPDAAKGMESDFALVVRMQMRGQRRVATIIKDWTGAHGAMAEIELPDDQPGKPTVWDAVFGPPLAQRADAKAEARAVDDNFSKDAASFGAKVATPDRVAELYGAIEGAGYDPEELRSTRNWPEFSLMPADMVEQLLAWALSRQKDDEADPTEPAESLTPTETTATAGTPEPETTQPDTSTGTSAPETEAKPKGRSKAKAAA